MCNPKFLEKGVEVAIFASPIRLNVENFMLDHTLNMSLKLQKKHQTHHTCASKDKSK
jgi:hypothetical protein